MKPTLLYCYATSYDYLVITESGDKWVRSGCEGTFADFCPLATLFLQIQSYNTVKRFVLPAIPTYDVKRVANGHWAMTISALSQGLELGKRIDDEGEA